MPGSSPRLRRARLAAAVAVAVIPAVVLAGCGSSSNSTPSATSPSATASSPSDGVTVDGVTVTGGGGQAPTVTVATNAPAPTALVTKDLVEGTGTEAKAGATITANYVGVGMKTGKVFDSSWSRGEPAQFPLDGVIKGWQEGIPGMKAGGRRVLIIPAADAYGATPPPGSGIQPDEPLVFVVDLVSVP